jgi:thiosulfate reductase / polysulfide reductase chain A
MGEIEVTKNVVCGGCSHHCRVVVSIEDGKVVSQEYRSKESSSASSKMTSSIVKSCPRARSATEFLYHPDRINYPLKRVGQRGDNKWQRVTWEEALDDIASRLAEIRDKHRAEAVSTCAVGEGNCMEEYRARFQNLFGTPNFASQAQICYGVAAALSMFHVGGMIQFPFLNRRTRCVMLIGRTPDQAERYEWLTILNMLESGGKLIVLDPRPSGPAQRANVWLQLRPGTDAAVLLGMAVMNPMPAVEHKATMFTIFFPKNRKSVAPETAGWYNLTKMTADW